ncbi:DUF4133 domain-containing protein [Sunxiuqinia elliptica]|uniref:Uncharacterized protein DUF4133 n=1 Tax=Sunxiuqinia elliptica TaxID=655355 RepID=A0A4R6HCE2_9BACT|nr:DUF4133 domain-containing protein [Sunxiuqinia elliptica]TDO05375.1 uncharacterized protein DUF4133 [Sunxiuqinia elliptica]TDO64922.1 uncharacterized protein DUF4133 [Sunxiuqinia elliptica]
MMETYKLQKVDTKLYIKGLSGPLVFQALYGILSAFLLFVILYISIGAFIATLICVPSFFAWLYRVSQIQKKYGPAGWNKRKTAKKLPQFIQIKRRIHQNQQR